MYKRSRQGWLKHADFILLDIMSVVAAFGAAFYLRFVRDQFLYVDKLLYRNIAIWLVVADILTLVIFNTMHDVVRRNWFAELRQTLVHGGLVFSEILVMLFSLKDIEQVSRIVLWLTFILYCVLSYALRMLWKHWLLRRGASRNQRVMLLVADSTAAGGVLEHFQAHPVENIRVCGVVLVDRDAQGEAIAGVPVVANMQDAAQYICREWIDEVYFGVSSGNLMPYEMIDKCGDMGVTVHIQLLSAGKGKQVAEKIAGMSVVTSSINIASPAQLLLKRVLDIMGGLACSFVALIVMAVFGPMIKKASPGPILYAQERIGQNGRKFKMYKIRSMYMDADARKKDLMAQNRVTDGRMFKIEWDPRVIGNEILPDGTRKTGIGEFIRKWSLDEFPQGFNLLLGQMSLVGTRPPTVDEWEKYELHHRARLATKPGITGMWQVSGRSEITDFEEVTKLDTQYIANWSIWLDLKILVKTVGAVLKRKGAM